jgi:phenylacetic acid degradation operon negative regulatory protein
VATSRSLLLTILGEFVLPDGGSVWTSTLVDAMGAVGVGERTTRQTIARVADRGLLRSDRHGRRTRWHLTEPARVLLSEGTERIYGLHHDPHGWDGRWLVLFASVPESHRALRYRLKTRLGWAGFAPVGPGAWISPWVDHEAEAGEILRSLGLSGAAQSFTGTVGVLGDVRRMVAQSWDLETIGAAYDSFIDRHGGRRPAGPRDRFGATTELVDDWRRFPFLDPDLPAELLPRRWGGQRAARLFHRLHARWSPAARSWWHQTANMRC